MSQFASVVVNLEDEVENPGDTLPVAGHIDAATYEAGEKSFSLDDGISYDVRTCGKCGYSIKSPKDTASEEL